MAHQAKQNIRIKLGEKLSTERPTMSAFIADITVQWFLLEQQLASVYAALLGTRIKWPEDTQHARFDPFLGGHSETGQ